PHEPRVTEVIRSALQQRAGRVHMRVDQPGRRQPVSPLDHARPPHQRLIGDLPNGRNASLLDDNVPRGINAVRPVAHQDVGAPDHDALALPAPATTSLLHTPPSPWPHRSVPTGPAPLHTITPVVAERAAPVTPARGHRPCLCDAS